jgi:hypothetical protein
MAFVRSGYVNITIGQAGIIGGNVYVRSRTASKDTNAYILASAISMVYPSYSDVRFYGFPLRCLYPGSA